MSHRAPSKLAITLRLADAQGRALVTMIDGHLSIILPTVERETVEAQGERVMRVVRALESAGISTGIEGEGLT